MSDRFHSQSAADSEVYYVARDGVDRRVAPHFRLGEFRCGDGTPILLVHPQLVSLLQSLRDHFGAPIHITSAFRTGAYNKQIGGAPRSKHLDGRAADVVVRGVSPPEVADVAEAWGVGGVGRYATFTHVDVAGRDRRWTG